MEEILVSLRLVAGKSPSPGCTLSSRQRRALFRVGSAPECNWRVHGPGVASHHCMLMWNGQELTVVDVGAGELFVDDRAVCGTAVVHSGRIRFGSAAIVVDSRGRTGAIFWDLDGARALPQLRRDDSKAVTVASAQRLKRPRQRAGSPWVLLGILVFGMVFGGFAAVLRNQLRRAASAPPISKTVAE